VLRPLAQPDQPRADALALPGPPRPQTGFDGNVRHKAPSTVHGTRCKTGWRSVNRGPTALALTTTSGPVDSDPTHPRFGPPVSEPVTRGNPDAPATSVRFVCKFRRLEAQNRRSPAGSQAMRSTPRCGDLRANGFAAHMANDAAAHACPTSQPCTRLKNECTSPGESTATPVRRLFYGVGVLPCR